VIPGQIVSLIALQTREKNSATWYSQIEASPTAVQKVTMVTHVIPGQIVSLIALQTREKNSAAWYSQIEASPTAVQEGYKDE
jgi:hypothetical protein